MESHAYCIYDGILSPTELESILSFWVNSLDYMFSLSWQSESSYNCAIYTGRFLLLRFTAKLLLVLEYRWLNYCLGLLISASGFSK